MKDEHKSLWKIFRDFVNPRTPGRGQGKHRAGSGKPRNWRQALDASRKRERQARKKARRIASGRKHMK
jgi:hypothetical protein